MIILNLMTNIFIIFEYKQQNYKISLLEEVWRHFETPIMYETPQCIGQKKRGVNERLHEEQTREKARAFLQNDIPSRGDYERRTKIKNAHIFQHEAVRTQTQEKKHFL